MKTLFMNCIKMIKVLFTIIKLRQRVFHCMSYDRDPLKAPVFAVHYSQHLLFTLLLLYTDQPSH